MVLIEQDLSSEGESNYKIAQQLFELGKNIDAKTELSENDINRLLKQQVFATCLSDETVDIHKLNDAIATNFKQLRVSLRRKGRGEAVQLGKASSMHEGQGGYWKGMMGLNR